MLVSLVGLCLLLWAAFDTARWVLPIVVLGVFWPVLLSDADLSRLRRWPLLFRFPLETAGILLLLGLAYIGVAQRVDARFWGILGGIAAALAVAVRGRIEADARGDLLERSVGLLSLYTLGRAWVRRPPPSITDNPKWR